MWVKKNWPALLAIALQAESLWKFLKWAMDWRGRYDALAATYHEIGGASAVIGYILDPPPWFYPLAFFAGLILIWWNFYRNRRPVHIHHVELREHMAVGASVESSIVNNNPNATAYFDCSIGQWVEAESPGKDTFNISVMKFGMEEPTVALSSGPVSKDNYNKQFSSVAPLKCEIIFHGVSPIFNIEIPFAVDIFETIWGDNRNSSGNRIKTINMPFSLKQVLIPNKNVFTVYVYSFDVDAYIGMRTPEKFTFVTNDGSNRYEGKFIAPNSPSMLVGPRPPRLGQNTSAGPNNI